MSDIRFAIRQLLRAPGFAFVAIATLALGIGVCTAMFGVVRAVVLKPLPVHEPDRLVWIENNRGEGLSNRTLRADTMMGWRDGQRSFESLAGLFAFSDYLRPTMTGNGEPERLRSYGVTQNLLPTVGVPLLLGRNFTADEGRFQGPPAAILSHAFWQRRFGGDPAVVGKTITLNGQTTAIVGVLPRGLRFRRALHARHRDRPARAVRGLDRDRQLRQHAVRRRPIEARRHRGTGRIGSRDRQPPADGHDDEGPALRRRGAAARHGDPRPLPVAVPRARRRRRLHPRDRVRQPVEPAAGAHERAAPGAERASRDRREPVAPPAAGAGREPDPGCRRRGGRRAARDVGTSSLAKLRTFGVPMLQEAAVDPVALAVSLAITGLTGLACGVLPALYATRSTQAGTLRDATQQRSAGRSAVLARNTLVVAEVALACILLVGAGLLIRSFGALLQVDLGFRAENAMAWRIDSPRQFTSGQDVDTYLGGMAAKVAAVPGVIAVGMSDTLPLGRNRTWGAGLVGETYPPDQSPIAYPRLVSPTYLKAMQIPLIEGRGFDLTFNPTAAKAVIISEALARQLSPGRSPVGRISA